MTEHLSRFQVERLCMSALPEDELAAAAVHTTECQFCDQRFVEELKRQRGPVPFNFTLEPEFWFRNDHLEFDDLVGLAENAFDEETREIINIHLSTCESCREDVRSFLTSRETSAGEMDVSYGPSNYTAKAERGAPWWQRVQARPLHAVAATVLVVVAVLISLIALNKRAGLLQTSKPHQASPQLEQNPIPASSPVESVTSNSSSVDDSAKVASLKDGGGEVSIDKSGRVTGLDEVPENSRRYVAQAALSGHIAPAQVWKRLSGEQSSLRGSNTGEQGFSLLYPLRNVVIEDRPTFRWERLAGSSSYQVYLLDANGKQVGQSGDLPSNQTQWKVPARLRRGEIFSWAVTALVDGKKIVSPAASDPEMKFAVLSGADFQELTRLKKSNSHLALGVFYARAGLLSDAERELQNLADLNPQSELPKKLLQSVRGMKQAN
jgi:hypothetical protein